MSEIKNEKQETQVPIEQDLKNLIKKEIANDNLESVEDGEHPISMETVEGDIDSSEIIVGGDDQIQLDLESLSKDATTPGESMKHLENFVKSQEEEVEAARLIYEKNKAQDEAVKAFNAKQKQRTQQFNDNIVKQGEDVTEPIKEQPQKTIESTKPTKDLSRLKVVKPLDESKIYMSYMAEKKKKAATTSIPMPNSGYTAAMRGMSSPEIRDASISLNSKDQFGSWDFLYKTIYDRVLETSIGQMDYITFLRSTALTEVQTLLYGLFDATYPDSNEYPGKCPKCNAKFDFKYENKRFLHIDDEDKYEASKDIRALIAGQSIDPKAFFATSNTNTLIREELDNSGIIVDLRHPTLYNQLYDVIKQLTDNRIDTDAVSEVTLNRMPYVEAVYIPVNPDNMDEGYYQLQDLMTKVNVLSQLDDHDDAQLELAISDEILSKYKIYYKMDDVKCPLCQETVPGGDVDFRTMLFMMQQIKSDIKRK